MPSIIEFREFYLRATSVVSGSKKDQQTNYPVQYQVTDAEGNQIMGFNRFLKDHFPSEDVFKKLFESLTFKLNPEDKATNVQQGLVRLVTGLNIINREDKDITGYTHPNIDTVGDFITVVLPSTLPVVSAGTGISVNVIIRNVSDDAVAGTPYTTGTLYYVDYEVANTAPNVVAKEYVNAPYKLDFTAFNTLSDDPNNVLYASLGTHSILANKLLNSLSQLKYDIYWVKGDGLINEPSIEVFIGKSTNINSCISVGNFQLTGAGNIGKQVISSIKLNINREAVDGYFSKADIIHYQTSTILAADFSNGFGFLDTVNGHLYTDSFKVKTTGTPSDTKIDWATIMYVHFRVKKDGSLDAQTENKVRIYGYNTNP